MTQTIVTRTSTDGRSIAVALDGAWMVATIDGIVSDRATSPTWLPADRRVTRDGVVYVARIGAVALSEADVDALFAAKAPVYAALAEADEAPGEEPGERHLAVAETAPAGACAACGGWCYGDCAATGC